MGPCSAPRLLYSVSVSHSAYSVGASNCSLGSTGQKRPNPTNKQYLRHSPALRGSYCAHSHTSASGTFTTQSTTPFCRRCHCRCVALRSPVAAPAPASCDYSYYPFSCACTCTCLLHLHQIFLVSSRTASHLFPPGSQNPRSPLSRRPHYQMVRFLHSPPSLFSCRDVDEEEDWPPDTDRTLTPAPATTTQSQSPERNRWPPVLLR